MVPFLSNGEEKEEEGGKKNNGNRGRAESG
jgi:hypothetical protein